MRISDWSSDVCSSDLALRIPGTSLTQSLEMQFQIERSVKQIPEVKTYFSRVGTAEVATDPMPPNISDGYVMLKDKKDWPDPEKPKAEVVADIEQAPASVPGDRTRTSLNSKHYCASRMPSSA